MKGQSAGQHFQQGEGPSIDVKIEELYWFRVCVAYAQASSPPSPWHAPGRCPQTPRSAPGRSSAWERCRPLLRAQTSCPRAALRPASPRSYTSVRASSFPFPFSGDLQLDLDHDLNSVFYLIIQTSSFTLSCQGICTRVRYRV